MIFIKDKYFLDTNILVYAYDKTDPSKQQKAQDLLKEGLKSEKAVISSQVLSEFYVTLTQKLPQPLSRKEAKAQIVLLSALEVIPVDVQVIYQAIDYQQRWKVSYWDALILSAAQYGKCSIIYSENFSAAQRYGSLKIHNIFKV